MVGVVDYEAGNLRSVETALNHLGADFFISERPEDFQRADRMIFPGVGEASSAMSVLIKTGLRDAVLDFAASGKPLLGICLGCQIVFTSSEEGSTACLDLIPGVVRHFPRKNGYKVPHMGWNSVRFPEGHPLFRGIPQDTSFYFVHSFYPAPAYEEHRLGLTEYGISFASAAVRDNLAACQFHPEKSGRYGLRLLENFLQWEGA